MAEQVNHPKHYNARKDGMECINIIRHYTCDIANAIKYLWRAGMKVEMGKSNLMKEIEDLHKSLWYIVDYLSNNKITENCSLTYYHEMRASVYHTTSYSVFEIIAPYGDEVSKAIEYLLFVGLIHDGQVLHVYEWREFLLRAQEFILIRIDELEAKLETIHK